MDTRCGKPSVILSDSSANQDLIEQTRDDLNDLDVYAASQINAHDYYKEAKTTHSAEGASTTPEPSTASSNYNHDSGYGIYGARAAKVVADLLNRATDQTNLDAIRPTLGWGYRARSFFGIQRVRDPRTILIATMAEAQRGGDPFILDDGTEITFHLNRGDNNDAGEDGVRNDKDANFHIWRVNVTKGEFVEALKPEYSHSETCKSPT
jgi:hypothetical protein